LDRLSPDNPSSCVRGCRTGSIPVVFISGYFGKYDEKHEGKGINVGGYVYPCIGKPVLRNELLEFVGAHLKEI
jgi:hypothetical protein